jgi:uncharacterized protein
MLAKALSLPPAFWLLATIATLLVGMVKAGFGGAATTLGVPLIALVVPPPLAAAVLLPVLVALDAIGLVVYRRGFDRRQIARLLPGACVGLVVGYLLFERVDVRWLRVIIGMEAAWFGIDVLRQLRRHAPLNTTGTSPTAGRAAAWGAWTGFTSFLAHAGGPPLLHYLLPLKLEKTRMVATVTIFFAIVNFVKLVPYAHLGLIDLSSLQISVLLLPAVPVGFWMGYRLMNIVNPRQLNFVVACLLLVTGAKLIADGIL